MESINFTPKTDVDDYLNNDFNVRVFQDLTEEESWEGKSYKGLFDPLAFFNLLYEKWEVVIANKNRPYGITSHILGLDLSKEKLHFLLGRLASLIDEKNEESRMYGEGYDEMLARCSEFLRNGYKKLENEISPEPKSPNNNEDEFINVKKHLETLSDPREKLKYLNMVRTEQTQNNIGFDFNMPSFRDKCNLETQKILKDIEIERSFSNTITKIQVQPKFNLSSKSGAKVNLVRVLDALYYLHLIEKQNGERPNKQEFMVTFGDFLGADLSNYSKDLSQALNAKSETHLEVFYKMLEKAKKDHDNKQK